MRESTCKKKLSDKIAINIREGKYNSKSQAIAVAYSQVRNMCPDCRRYFLASQKK